MGQVLDFDSLCRGARPVEPDLSVAYQQNLSTELCESFLILQVPRCRQTRVPVQRRFLDSRLGRRCQREPATSPPGSLASAPRERSHLGSSGEVMPESQNRPQACGMSFFSMLPGIFASAFFPLARVAGGRVRHHKARVSIL